MVLLARGTRIMIKADSEFLECTMHHSMVTINNLLRGDAFFFRFNSDRHPVLVRTANKLYISAAHSQVSHIDI